MAEPVDDRQRLLIFPDIGSQGSDPREILVRFYNITRYDVDVFWLNARKEPTKYGRLRHKQYLDIKTFSGHPWVARRSSDGCTVLMNKQSVFWPQPAQPNVIVRTACIMTMNLQSLKELCARSLMDLTPVELAKRVQFLPIDVAHEVRHLLKVKREYERVICRPPPQLPRRRQ